MGFKGYTEQEWVELTTDFNALFLAQEYINFY